MEGKKMVKVMMILNIIMMVMGMVVGQAATGSTPTTPFPLSDCYGRCMFFCLIQPQNMCTCTSTCLKKCLDKPASNTMALAVDEHEQTFGYCKLGCVTSLCSNINKANNLDGESMGRCVDTCSSKCTQSYYMAP